MIPFPQASSHAADIDVVVWLVHVLMLVLFAGWGGYFVFVLARFRRSRKPFANSAGAKGRFALATEIGVIVAEVALLVGLALPMWYDRTWARPVDASVLAVRVVAEQFVWNVHYPGPDGQFGDTAVSRVAPDNPLGLDRASSFGRDDIVEQNQLHLPVGRPVLIQLSSKDVIHSFGVPAMRVKQDAIPGHVAPIWFTPTLPGRFDIACSQLCGMAHYRMRGELVVESAEDFRKYLAGPR